MAAGNLWEGMGNLIERTHVLEVSTTVLAGVLNGLAMIFPTTAANAANLKNKLDEAGTAQKEFGTNSEEGQNKAKAAIDATNTALEKQIKNLIRIRQLNDSLNDEKTAGALADVDEREARGELQPYQANAARARIKRDSDSAKAAQEHATTRVSLDAAMNTRKGATGAADQAGAEADAADQAVASAAAKSGLDPEGLKFAFQTANSDAAKARESGNAEELARAEDTIKAVQALAKLKGEAANKEQAYQAALKNEKAIFESTSDSIQKAADALTVLEEKFKRLQAQTSAGQAKDTRVIFDKTAEIMKTLFDVDIKAGPSASPTNRTAARTAPPVVISEAEKANKARLDAESAARPADPKALQLRETMEREKGGRATEQEKQREKWGIEDRLEKLKSKPSPAPSGDSASAGTTPLGEAAESANELTVAITAFAAQSISLHGNTSRTLEKLATALSDLESRMNCMRIG